MVPTYCPGLLLYYHGGWTRTRNPLWCGGEEDLIDGDFLERVKVQGGKNSNKYL